MLLEPVVFSQAQLVSNPNRRQSSLKSEFIEKEREERRSVTRLAPLQLTDQIWKSEDSLPLVSVSSTSSAPLVSSGSTIRSRFLNRLGFADTIQQQPGLPSHPTRSVDPPELLNRKDCFQTLLKADHGENDRVLEARSPIESTLSDNVKPVRCIKTTRRNHVSFDPKVNVVTIPSRKAYSNRIRKTIWTSLDELQHNVARNTLEFTAENWDWRQVADESDMVYYEGHWVHPVHFMAPEYSASRQFTLGMTAQQQPQAQSN